ncbi:MAG TPA: glucose 1-dehydrogenase [Solirubrobacteraceae bacterium]|nr:glucose 1-dehydrogenase [Solirubrobacteraceae bacterium]
MTRARAAIVTGGGGGIGEATARRLAERGFAVLIVDIDADRAAAVAATISGAGGEASSFAGDVSDPTVAAGYVQACQERYGAPAAFFNNAGYEGQVVALTEYPLEEFDRTFAVNVRGVFLGLQHVLPAMRAGGGGSILNTASQAGLRGVANLSAYCASKHAVVGLSRAAALEEAPWIRVNALAPGPTSTRMMEEIDAAVTAQGGDPASFTGRIAMGRYGYPNEIAQFAVWLLADAPPYLTGAVLPIDGAMTTA